MSIFRRKKTVAVLDDEPSLVALLRACLEDAGYKVMSFGNPLEALERMDDLRKADLMVLDVLMPNLNGYQFLSRARKLGLDKTPVIMLSALNDAGGVSDGYSQGADYYLTKPFDVDDLVRAVRYYLGDLPEDEVNEIGHQL